MSHSRSILWRVLGASLLSLAALAYPACVGTPLPDPPSFAQFVSWSESPQSDSLRFVGHAGAVVPGGSTIRITDPPSAGVEIATDADGAFGRVVPAAAGDTIYVERITADADVFVGAFVLAPLGALTPTGAGTDTDGDHTPDVIDCAPGDATHAGQRCGTLCSADSDCAIGQSCFSGRCVVGVGCVPEICNGIDDDCNGTIDDGDPETGVACMPSPGTCGSIACGGVRGTACMPVVTPDHETCGNGIDDDCNGTIDDGCP